MTTTEWLMGGDTGISSMAIFAVMTGIRTIDRADCEKIVDDFYAAHRGTTGARQRR